MRLPSSGRISGNVQQPHSLVMLESLDGNYRTWEQTRKDNSDLYRALRNKFLPSFVDEEDLLGIWESSFDQ